MLETFLRDFGPYCHDSITQLLQICRLHIHDENFPFHHIPKVLYWIEIWWQGKMDPCFHVLYAKFWPYHLNVAAEIETHQTRKHFSNLLLSNFGESVWIVASVCCSYLTGAAPSVVFCCWSPSASGFDVLCVQRWYSAYLGCIDLQDRFARYDVRIQRHNKSELQDLDFYFLWIMSLYLTILTFFPELQETNSELSIGNSMAETGFHISPSSAR